MPLPSHVTSRPRHGRRPVADGPRAERPVLRCLLVEDSPEFIRIASTVLGRSRFHVDAVGSGEEALQRAAEHDYDLVLLDVTLPGIDGFDVCRRIRAFSDTYVLMISGRASEVDRVVGLRLGADDYITKPYSPAELEARISAVRRRPRTLPLPAAAETFGRLVVDPDGREARVGDRAVSLTRIEFDLVATLSRQPARVFDRHELMSAVWGHQQGDVRLVDVHIANLRRKLRAALGHQRHIRTVQGSGYRFDPRGDEDA